MTKDQLHCLACSDDRWRTVANLKAFRGADVTCLDFLADHRLIEARLSGDWRFRITITGQAALVDRGVLPVTSERLRKRSSNGGWRSCDHGHRYQGQQGCPECRGEGKARAPGYSHAAKVRRLNEDLRDGNP